MKFKCNCGKIIVDQTDFIPYKGYIVPDEAYFGIFDSIDELLDSIKNGKSVDEEDYMHLRQSFPQTRAIYQCFECGRIFIWDNKIKGVFSFKPEDDDVNKELLRKKVT